MIGAALFATKAKELLSNIDNEDIRQSFYEWYCRNNEVSKDFTMDDLIEMVVRGYTLYIEDMMEYCPARKDYWEDILSRYGT